MNYLKMVTSGLAVGLSVMLAGNYSLASNSTQEEAANLGIIHIKEEGQEGEVCSFSATEGMHYIESRCNNDGHSFKFEKLESALTIAFFNERECRYEDQTSNWMFKLKTIKQPASTEYILLTTAWSAANGSIIAPGVIKVFRSNNAGDNINDALSCINISRE